jgi:predicted nucleotidyltransferase component of viral defense system
MIGLREATEWARRLGVAIEQVQRDHLVSHVLALLPQLRLDGPFVGGTALARTYLDGLRVSEDIDLMVEDVPAVGEQLNAQLPRLLRREYPDARLSGSVPAARGLRLHLTAADVPMVEVQLINVERERQALPFQMTPVALRYDRLPEHVPLMLPTAEAFVAMKVAAYRDRSEPRDLFDLAHLAVSGAVNHDAATLTSRLTGALPSVAEFRRVARHTAMTWHDRLAHQTAKMLAPEEALQRVRTALEALEM